MSTITCWAVVTKDGDVIATYFNRITATRRREQLNIDAENKQFAPFSLVPCEGTFTPAEAPPDGTA